MAKTHLDTDEALSSTSPPSSKINRRRRSLLNRQTAIIRGAAAGDIEQMIVALRCQLPTISTLVIFRRRH